MVLSEKLATALEGASRYTITIDMPPPLLVVEVVSPGKENADRDYRYKPSMGWILVIYLQYLIWVNI